MESEGPLKGHCECYWREADLWVHGGKDMRSFLWDSRLDLTRKAEE